VDIRCRGRRDGILRVLTRLFRPLKSPGWPCPIRCSPPMRCAPFLRTARAATHARCRSGTRAGGSRCRRDPGRGAVVMRGIATCVRSTKPRCAMRRAMRAISPFRWSPHSRARGRGPSRGKVTCTGATSQDCSTRHCAAAARRCSLLRAISTAAAALRDQALRHRTRCSRPHVDQQVCEHARPQTRRHARRGRRHRDARGSRCRHRGAAVRGAVARWRRSARAAGRRGRPGRRIRLAVANVPWHTQRDRSANSPRRSACSSHAGKLARDSHARASEVGEAFEPQHGPRRLVDDAAEAHPVGAAIALAAATRVHRSSLRCSPRGAGARTRSRQLAAEWERCEIVLLAAGALDAMAGAIAGLESMPRACVPISTSRRASCWRAVQMALAHAVGRDVAHALVADACARPPLTRHLREVLAASAQ